ncbi:protein phosphatase [Streptomyces sp. SAT1]|uniref:ADP-ribosyltransferase n=1 Tax=Streptomyces sp. SAT1 TaxID=1849967 RepID=UPI0007DD3022|nr:ADP-ribosyltransferase [Streptomyces sp. SAT1]ANH91522.1 protein phosphatase [Streptomyces sp. SAT1]
MIKPEEIPQFTGDLELLEKAYGNLKADAGHIRSTGQDVHTKFQGLSAYYRAPEAEQLFASTKPVKDRADTFATGLESVSGALSGYATEIRPLVKKLEDLKDEATTFVDSVKDDDDWQYDGDKVGRHNRIRDEITRTVAAFWAAERTCHNKITALFHGTQMVAGDGSDRKDQYGFDADDLKNAKLPWGDPVEEKHHWYEVGHWVKSFVWDGLIVDGVWGTIKGLGTLVGFGGWEAMGQAWKGLAQLATGLVLTSLPGLGTLFWALPDDKLPSWIRDSRTAMKETGKALVAWDEWGKNPARAAGAVTFNVLTTVFTGGAGGAASGAGKAGAVAKALSVAGKAGRVIDPMTYVAKGAGAGLSKIGDITKALKGIGKIDMPTLPDGSVHLPDGRLLDPHGNITAANGIPETTPVPHETVPNAPKVPGLPDSWTIHGQQPVHTGVHTGADGVSHTADPAAHYGHTPSPSPYDHTVPPSSYDHTPPPSSYDHAPASYDHTPTHTPTHDVPTHDVPGSGGHGHTSDAPNGHGHGHGHDGTGHTEHGGGDHTDHHGGGHHTDGHADDASHVGDHVDLDHPVLDATAHHGADAPATPVHDHADVPGHGTGEPFEYKPQMSDRDFDALDDAEKHAVAEAELSRGTNTAPSASNKAGLEYGNAYWNKFLDDLTPESREALRTYSGNEYDLINGHLRFGAPVDDALKHTIAEMDDVMDTRPVPEDIMIVRGTGVDHVKVGGRAIDSPLDMLGGTFDDKAFTSTALGKTPPPPFDQKPVWMHLRVAKGTPALWIDHLSKYPGERELLLARGSEYKVTRVFFDEAQGKWHIYGEVLPRTKP